MHVVSISGSPAASSRSTALLHAAEAQVRDDATQIEHVAVRDLPPGALLSGDVDQPAIRAALDKVARADLVIIATPIYKAAYSGLLKAFLDLLPRDALRERTVLPLATGGSATHLLALDYALRPVLAALGARHVLDAVFAVDAQFMPDEQQRWVPAAPLHERLARALQALPVHRCRV